MEIQNGNLNLKIENRKFKFGVSYIHLVQKQQMRDVTNYCVIHSTGELAGY